ncbi:MAG TPA: HTTM domain-containing protein [Polyangiales bacterium]|nr:HTTM domain-containing protein [Polyangiales bacterium]
MPRLAAEPPLGLAALRIALGAVILISPELWQAPYWAGLPAHLRFPPEGLGWALQVLPIDQDYARAAQALLIASCAAAILGLRARLAMLGVTLFGLYVFGLSQLSGAVIHNMHLFWFSALLAVSPCGDALTLQRWLRGQPYTALPAALAYTVPLQCARVLLAAVYFFPGFWKLKTSGLTWIFSDNLRNQIYWKWFEIGATAPTLRVDQQPWLLQLAAAAVVVFELGFITLIWSRRGRMLAAFCGVLFHLGTQWIMGITFISLIACYVMLLDWEGIARALGQAAPAMVARGPLRSVLPALLLSVPLICIVFVQGARGAVQAWPLGCYPTFDRTVGDYIADLRIEVVREDGTAIAIPDGPSTGGHLRAPQDWARAWRLAGFYDDRVDPALLGHYFEHLLREPRAAAVAAGATRVRFYAATYSVFPGRAGQPPLSMQLLAELPLPITPHPRR